MIDLQKRFDKAQSTITELASRVKDSEQRYALAQTEALVHQQETEEMNERCEQIRLANDTIKAEYDHYREAARHTKREVSKVTDWTKQL